MQKIFLLGGTLASNFLLLSLLLLISFFAADAQAGARKYGGVPGEKLTFNVHWLGIPAGHAEMNMYQADAGKYSVEAMVEAIGMVKFIHAIKDKLQSVGDILASGEFRTISYNKDQRKGSRIRQIEYKFDRNKKVVTRLQKGEKPKQIIVSNGEVSDPLSYFYSLRTMPELEPGKSLIWLTVDGHKEYKMQVDIGEKIKKYTPLGGFDVITVKVKIPSSKELFRQEEAIVIWFTADERRMPVRVETRLSVGSVAADLVAFDDGRGNRGELGED